MGAIDDSHTREWSSAYSFRANSAPTRRFGPLRLVTIIERCLPPAWNGSWNGAADNVSVAAAISAMCGAISAASTHGAQRRTYGKEKVCGCR
jgi:hypothetical protein